RLFEASNKEIVIEYNSVLSSQLMVLSISDTLQSEEKKLRKVPRFANACGAITTTKKGAIPALPSDSEDLSFIKDHQRRSNNPFKSKSCASYIVVIAHDSYLR
ncbi:unnamed protein product, partial [Brassica rapa]